MADRSSGEIRAQVVEEARAWLGTPYHHQQSVKAIGTDCLGLVRGIYRAVIGPEPALAPNYSRDWAEASGRETLREACEAYMTPVELAAAAPGDVLLFRMVTRAVAKHLGVIVAPGRMIHAFEGSGVIEQSIDEFTTRRRHTRIAGAFAFPGA